jgi:hypothetical protein
MVKAMFITRSNTRHFAPAVQRFGVEALNPRDFLRRNDHETPNEVCPSTSVLNHEELKKGADEEGTSINQFINVAVAESWLSTNHRVFQGTSCPRGHGSISALPGKRRGSEPPREGDDLVVST